MTELPDDPSPEPEPDFGPEPGIDPRPHAASQTAQPAQSAAPAPPDDPTPTAPIAHDAPAPAAPDDRLAFEDLVVELLTAGPLTAYGVVRAVERLWPGFLKGRRGYVHPVLLGLWRTGRIERTWMDLPVGRRRGYRTHTGAAWAPAAGFVPGERPGPRAELPERLERLVAKAARGLKFAPIVREDVQREIADHLADTLRALADDGETDQATCVAKVAREFGDAWRVRTDLRRTARGQRTVLFPRTLRESLHGALIYDAGVLLFIVAVIVFVRVQVVTAYHIPTRSMEPTLHGHRVHGDRILVNRLAGAPARFDICVFDGWGAERKNYVKRCAGLPNERLKIREGDLYVNGELVRKEGDVLEALLFPLWDLAALRKRSGQANPDDPESAGEETMDELQEMWGNVNGEWMVDALHGFHGTPRADGEDAVLRLHEPPSDDIVDLVTGASDTGMYDVPDLRLTVDVTREDAATELVIRLTRGAATYDVVVGGQGSRDDDPPESYDVVVGDQDGRVSLVVDGDEVATTDMKVPTGATTRIVFSQVDRVLRLVIDDVEVRHDLPQPAFPRRSAQSASIEFRILGGTAWVRPLRLERDIFWTPDYDNDEIELGPNEYFMLGDNSGNSQDSRRNGPVHRHRLVGKPIFVVWPLDNIRRPR